ncbi:GntR family transcriptional regulator [Saccharopolyspora shandongensis]|uniref:GntR family transcriptional regulator n=1 Tax=Saccharopolyspora shandongensis TaxID=418495 RepID=UPI0033EEDA9D
MKYVRPSTVERAVVAELRRMILQGELKPGSMILLDDIAQRFGVSRGPVRDALRILSGEALVVARPHRGYQVARLDVSELAEINGIRQLLETDAIRRAAEHLTDEVADEMAELLARMLEVEDAGDMATWVDVHRKFHFALFDKADSSVEIRALHTLWNASDLYRSEYLQSAEARKTSALQHGQLLKAVQARDVDGMIAVMDAHRGATMAALTETLPPASS